MLPDHDTTHLQAAEGWMELGNLSEATEELEQITPENERHPDVLELSCRILQAGGKWEWSLPTLETLTKQFPNRLNPWLLQARALHALGKTHLAYHLLVDVVELFPENQTIRYDIACYAAQRGLLEEAVEWLRIVFKNDGDGAYRKKALEDPAFGKIRADVLAI
ncbi:MAG: tetratricopeptide repeat protein [Verrucomicrobiales bacterium]